MFESNWRTLHFGSMIYFIFFIICSRQLSLTKECPIQIINNNISDLFIMSEYLEKSCPKLAANTKVYEVRLLRAVVIRNLISVVIALTELNTARRHKTLYWAEFLLFLLSSLVLAKIKLLPADVVNTSNNIVEMILLREKKI